MKNAVMSHLRFIIPLICTFTIGQSLPAQAPKAEKPKQFIYVLRGRSLGTKHSALRFSKRKTNQPLKRLWKATRLL
jgi:hypothetical protein